MPDMKRYLRKTSAVFLLSSTVNALLMALIARYLHVSNVVGVWLLMATIAWLSIKPTTSLWEWTISEGK